MIEIKNVKLVQKGALLATCDVSMPDKKMTLKDVRIFEKYPNRWVTMPCRDYVNDAQEKKYFEVVVFDSESYKQEFSKMILHAFEEYEKMIESRHKDENNLSEKLPF